MKTFLLLSVAILILGVGCSTDQSKEVSQLKKEIAELEAIVGSPPGSLDNLYPPKARGPIFLMKMYEINSSMVGIAIDMYEKDPDHARANFQRFRTQYGEVSKLVPEWEKAYPMDPVEELGQALEAGEPDQVMAALEKVGKVCHDCHIKNMVKVQYQYHWGDFSSMDVTDPVTKQDVNFRQFMQYLSVSLTGIMVDIEQGEAENALRQFQMIKARFQSLKQTCDACHDTERQYFVDQNVQALFDHVEAALKTDSPNPKVVGKFVQGIGMESCFKCHLVHLPPVYTTLGWKNREKNMGKQ